jgi:hypothetical protein
MPNANPPVPTSPSHSPSPSVSQLETRRAVVSTTRFPNSISWDAIKAYLRSHKVTGIFQVHMSEGGVNYAFFKEETDVNGATKIHIK